ncbi:MULTISPECIES: maleylpyruvate isomerase family mycothiol-dependent enzyme [Streptomyces]|uniref:maleylpyruvate isomerase family mycothiol-dependent enzyme n=1 Tax=Streptomyces TaxID=1883 RepID=UPI00034E7D95|nr:maleylpyruvate isomerase family mycothiol-dependent enzyme [Streptomyces sp. HPH0547]EPD91030.1 hypothetical protein HMPREF1486_05417 [Streptomyces sp. HPH0547]
MAYAFDHERYCAELAHQAGLFEAALGAAGPDRLAAPVPTCPEWTLRELTVHLGGAYRWFAHIVRTRATEPVSPADVAGGAGPGDDTGLDELAEWFADGARDAVTALREADPHAPTWSWADDHTPAFWARRATHETVVHRADACLAAGTDFQVSPEIAADCVDEWLHLLTLPQLRARKESLRLLDERAGARLHLHPADTPIGAHDATDDAAPVEWVIDLTAPAQDATEGPAHGLSWHRGHAKADVALRGPLTDLLLVLQRRLPSHSPRVEVLGDRTLLDLWLRATSFD